MKIILLSLIFVCLPGLARSFPLLNTTDLISGSVFRHDWTREEKGTLVVFLSAACPCSNAHIGHLKELAKTYTQIRFIGLHSNADESVEASQKYFRELDLPFPVLQDSDSEWADRLKAYRTPHAFLITPQGQIAYQGGITSSADPARADSLYLKVTLKKFLAGEKIDGSRTRVLGCQIARK